MASTYPNHDWRAEEFGTIRGRYAASVSRAWCASTTCSDPWRWSVFRTDVDDCSSIVPDETRTHGVTFAAAIAAAEAFIAARLAEDSIGNVFAFEGVPMAEECF